MGNHKNIRSTFFQGYNPEGLIEVFFWIFDSKKEREVKFLSLGVREEKTQQYKTSVFYHEIMNFETKERRELTEGKLKKYVDIDAAPVNLMTQKKRR